MKLAYAVIVFVALMASGCSTVSDAGYYWGNYSNTYYKYVKDPSDETLESHIAELNRIVEKSTEQDLQVPPGIYAELGYISGRQGDAASALAFYQKEMETYPQSKPFLERMIAGSSAENKE